MRRRTCGVSTRWCLGVEVFKEAPLPSTQQLAAHGDKSSPLGRSGSTAAPLSAYSPTEWTALAAARPYMTTLKLGASASGAEAAHSAEAAGTIAAVPSKRPSGLSSDQFGGYVPTSKPQPLLAGLAPDAASSQHYAARRPASKT